MVIAAAAAWAAAFGPVVALVAWVCVLGCALALLPPAKPDGDECGSRHLWPVLAFLFLLAAKDLAPHNIAVNALAPSRPIATPGLNYYRSELANTSPDDEFACAVVELAAVDPVRVSGRTVGHLQVLDGSFEPFTDIEQAMA